MVLKKRKAKKKVIKKVLLKKPRSKKKLVRKSAPRKKALPVKKTPKTKEKVIGTITHYFPHVRAAVIKLKTTLAVGDTIKIKGHTTDFTQTINSMQIDRVPVNSAKTGQEIGVLVNSRVRQHDMVYKG